MYGQEDYGRSYNGPPSHGGGGGGYGGGYGGGGGFGGGGMRRDLDSVQLRRPDFSNLPVRVSSEDAMCHTSHRLLSSRLCRPAAQLQQLPSALRLRMRLWFGMVATVCCGAA